MDALLRRRAMIAAGGGGPTPSYRRLPDGYKERAYMDANEGNAWIDTGVAGAADLTISVRFSISKYVQYGAVYGNYIDESHKNNRVILNSATQLLAAGGANKSNVISGFSCNRIHTVTVNSTTTYLESASTSMASTSDTNNTSNICLCSSRVNPPSVKDIALRIYAFSITKSGTPLLNYVPCTRMSDDKPGFYDLVNSTFVPSSSSADFVAGPVAEYSGQLLKCLDWSGSRNPTSSGNWYDSVGNQYWAVTNGTHGTDYYEFTNTNPASASQYATLFGSLPDLGYRWKVVADVAVKSQSSNPTRFVPFDFGGLGTVSSGTCGVCPNISMTNSKWWWGLQPPFNGPSSVSTYAADDYHLSNETGLLTQDTWVRRKITFGVRASETIGKDETFMEVNGLAGYIKSSTPYTSIRFNRWMTPMYIARSLTNPSSSYKYATTVRIYSLKIYYEPII